MGRVTRSQKLTEEEVATEDNFVVAGSIDGSGMSRSTSPAEVLPSSTARENNVQAPAPPAESSPWLGSKALIAARQKPRPIISVDNSDGCQQAVSDSRSAGPIKSAHVTERAHYLSPPPASGPSWQWGSAEGLIINSDSAEAGPNGIKEAFPATKLRVGMCSVHIEAAIQRNAYSHFKNRENAEIMGKDVESIRCHSLTSELAREGIRLMLEKQEALGEKYDGVPYFCKEWSNRIWTYAEMNEPLVSNKNIVKGGVPTQSNALERHNLAQKERKQFKRQRLVDYMSWAFHDLEQISMNDLTFGQHMARGYKRTVKSTNGNFSRSKVVWSQEFFARCLEELRSPCGIAHLMFNGSKIGPNVVLIASRGLKHELIHDFGILKNVKPEGFTTTLRSGMTSATAWPDGSKHTSFLQQFLNLATAGVRAVQAEGYNLDELLGWQRVRGTHCIVKCAADFDFACTCFMHAEFSNLDTNRQPARCKCYTIYSSI